MTRRLTELNRYVRGWMGYFGLARQFDDFVRTGRLDSSPRADVLLEAVATPSHQGDRNLVALGVSPTGDQTRSQSQRPLADVSNTCLALRDAPTSGLSNKD